MGWADPTCITTFRDHMKALRTRLAAASLTITAPQFVLSTLRRYAHQRHARDAARLEPPRVSGQRR